MITKPNFENSLISFGTVDRMPHTTDILEYWHKESLYSILGDVACVIICVPGTQVLVEKLLSHLKFIYSYLQSSLQDDTLNNLIIVRCNFHMLNDFFNNFK